MSVQKAATGLLTSFFWLERVGAIWWCQSHVSFQKQVILKLDLKLDPDISFRMKFCTGRGLWQQSMEEAVRQEDNNWSVIDRDLNDRNTQYNKKKMFQHSEEIRPILSVNKIKDV